MERCPSRSPKVRQVLEYLKTREGHVALHDIASHIGVNPDYLGRRFKREIGSNFRTYVAEKRIRNAEHLLRVSSKSIKEIAYELAFHSPEVFSKVFKRIKGCSPRMYREESALSQRTAQIDHTVTRNTKKP